MRALIAACALLFVATTPALAHGGGHVKGTVEKVDPTSITVKQTDAKIIAFTMTVETKFFQGDVPATLADVKKGSRVVVHLGTDGRVAEVHLPSAAKSGTLFGTILGRDTAKNTLTVEHEDVKGIMSAMTMAFPVRDAEVSELPPNGSRITAKLQTAGGRYWLTKVRRVEKRRS